MKISFSPPYIDNSVIDEVTDALNSGWITTGPKVKMLEDKVQEMTGAGAVLCVNSWTSGAMMILRWLGLQPGDEVIVPAYTYSATALAVIHAGGKPVMVDTNTDFNINVEAIKNAITPRTKAIMPVDFSGFPCDYDEIMSLVQTEEILSLFQADNEVQSKLGRILVIDDAAHSIGAFYKGKSVGVAADVVIFSFHAVKNITTAEGGAICLNLPLPFDNRLLYASLRVMTLNCQTKDAFTKSKAGSWRYDIIGLGMKINMPDVNAAIGLAQIRQYPTLLQERKRLFEKYSQGFAQYFWAINPPSVTEDKVTSYHLYPIRFKGISEQQRDLIIDKVAAAEVAVNVHFIPMPMLTYFKGLGYDINDYPQAFQNYIHEITLPIYPGLKDEEIDFIINTVVEAYESVVK